MSVLLNCSHLKLVKAGGIFCDTGCPHLKATDQDLSGHIHSALPHHVNAVGSYRADKVDAKLSLTMSPRRSVMVSLLAFLRE